MPDNNGLRRSFDDLENLYIAAIREVQGTITIDTQPEPLDVRLFGEVLVYATWDGEIFNIERVRRVALVGVLLEPRGAPEVHADVGVFSLAGPLAEVAIRQPGRDNDLTGTIGDLQLQLHYSILSVKAPSRFEDDHAHYPHQELTAGSLQWRGADLPEHRGVPLSVEIVLKLADRIEIGRITSVVLPWNTLDFVPAGTPEPEFRRGADESGPILGTSGAVSLNVCSAPATSGRPEMKTVRRRLRLRFIDWTQSSNPAVVDQSIITVCNTQLTAACEVWCTQAAMDFATWDGAILVAPEIEPGSQQDRIDFHAFSDGQKGDVPIRTTSPLEAEIYIVDTFTNGEGGGKAYNLATGMSFCVLSLAAMQNNSHLLAHELGHVIGLADSFYNSAQLPDPAARTPLFSSPGSIMQTGSNPPYNTLYNCQVFLDKPCPPPENNSHCPYSPLVSNTTPTDYFQPDPPYYVSTYPSDVGAEPLAPNGEYYWLAPHVWNRRSQSPGGGGMVHENPHSDDAENYMYVRLTRKGAVDNPVNVQLFLADPGNPSTMYPLDDPDKQQDRNTVSFPSGAAGTIDLPHKWVPQSVLAHLPAHCCVFALVNAIDEPAPSPASGLWLIQRVGIYRDVAMHNMNTVVVTSKAQALGGAGAGAAPPTPLHINLPWVQFVNPLEQPYQAVLSVDTSQAAELLGLTLEGEGDGWHEALEAGGRSDVLLHEQLGPGAHLVLRLSATLPAGLPPGLELPIGLSFSLDRQLIGGYHFVVRVGSLAEATGQMLKGLAGLLHQLASGFGLAAAASASRSVSRLARSYVAEPERALESLRRRASSIRDLAEAIHGSPEPEAVNIQRGLFELAGVVAHLAQSTETEQMVERIRGLADRIQEPAGRVARRRRHAQDGTPAAIAKRPPRRLRVLTSE